MKKVLLASTALVAFAGAAAAEVKIEGNAEMGVIGGDGLVTQFFQDVDIDFKMSGETDGGLTFWADVDLDEANSLGSTGSFTDTLPYSVGVSGEFGNVSLGDVDGALDWALAAQSWGNAGSIADDETAHWGWQDSYLDGSYDGQILRYDYSINGFGFAVSLEQDDNSDLELAVNEDGRDRYDYNWAIGVKYDAELGAGTLKLGAGYQAADAGSVGFGLTDGQVDALASELSVLVDAIGDLDAITDTAVAGAINFLDTAFGYRPGTGDDSDQFTVSLGENATVWGLSAGYEMDNGFSFGAVYSDWDSDALDSGSHWGLGAGYTWDAFTISANYGEHDFEYKSGGKFEAKGWGIAAGYDLGGGLSVLAGYGKSEADISGSYENGTYDADDVFTGDGTFSDFSTSTDGDTYSFGLSMSF